MLLRSQPMECLGGRCPFEVVTGLKPRMPASMASGFPVEARDVNAYVKDLTQHLARVYDTVQRIKKEIAERDEVGAEGRLGYELNPGDPVLVKRTGDRQGPTRFRERGRTRGSSSSNEKLVRQLSK